LASLRKRGKVWYYRFADADGIYRERKGCSDKRATEEMARDADSEAAKVRAGLVDPKDLARREHAAKPLVEHIEAWSASQEARGLTPKHVALSAARVRRLVAIIRGAKLADVEPPKNAKRGDLGRFEEALAEWLDGARLADLTPEASQAALRSLIGQGISLATANHYRTAVKAFTRWAWKTGRLASDPLVGLGGYNAKEDPRHDRRAIGLDELQRLVRAAHEGCECLGMPGPARALAYRLAVATGLRYSEIRSIAPESFNWSADPPTVTVAAGYTKNGQIATLPLTEDLGSDLRPYVASVPPGSAVFPLPAEKGATLLRFDLEAAGIPYVDEAGRYFDFHSLRGMTATLADAAGISPRVVQKLMRHSTLELTGKYTRPRTADVHLAAQSIPSLRPDSGRPHPPISSDDGTNVQPIRDRLAHYLPRTGAVSGRDLSGSDVLTKSDAQPGMNAESSVLRRLTHPDGLRRGEMKNTGVGTRTPDLRIMRPPL